MPAENRPKTSRRGGPRRNNWKPGQSGNPKGRPKIPPEYKAALKMLDPMAGQAIGEILADKKHPRRGQMAEYVWNRNHGMPRARTELSTPPGQPLEVREVKRTVPTSDDLRREVRRLMGQDEDDAPRLDAGADEA